MESDKAICVREQQPAPPGGTAPAGVVAIVDVETATSVRYPISADSALMNPTEKILALKGLGEKDSLYFPLFFFLYSLLHFFFSSRTTAPNL